MTERKVLSKPPVEHHEPLHIRWRPKVLQHVYGQREVCESIEQALKAKARQHTYFFLGPTGTGKTTLARIMGSELKCDSIIEVDAATNSGIDAMRELMAGARYAGFGENPNRAYLVDECQGLSKQAWDSMLKITEEPPEHVFFFFCSTNHTKIPAAALTRGPQYHLNLLRYDDLMDLLEDVAKGEELPTPNVVLQAVARACSGSPRQALVMLAMVAHCATEQEAAPLLLTGGETTKEVIDLCRQMVGGRLTWPGVVAALKAMTEQSAEGIRIQVTLYLAAVLMGKIKGNEVDRLMRMLLAFSRPCNPTDKLAPIMLAFGEFIDLGDRP